MISIFYWEPLRFGAKLYDSNFRWLKFQITKILGIKPDSKQKLGVGKKEKVIKQLDKKATEAELKSGLDPIDAKAKSERRRELLGGLSTGMKLPKIGIPSPFQSSIFVNIDGQSIALSKKNENALYTRFMDAKGKNYRFLRSVH